MKSLLIIFSFFFLSFTYNKETKPIVIDFLKLSQQTSIENSILKEIQRINLVVEKNAIIGANPDIEITNNNIYVFDINNKCVLVFDNKGLFLNKAGVRGRGPGEFLGCEDFHVDSSTGNIEILSYRNNKVYKYSKKGIFIRTMDTKVSAYSFIKDKSGSYWFCKGPFSGDGTLVGNDQLYKTSGDGKVLNKFFPVDNNAIRTPSPDKCLTTDGMNILFRTWFSPKVYKINLDGSITNTFTFNFGEFSLPENILSFQPEQFMKVLMKSHFFIIRYLENKDFAYFYISNESSNGITNYHLIFNKKTAKSVLYKIDSSDLSPINQGPAKILTYNNELIFIYLPEDIVKGVSGQIVKYKIY